MLTMENLGSGNIHKSAINVHEDCQNARIYVLMYSNFVAAYLGFLRRLVHSQYHDNGKTNTTNRIDRAFFILYDIIFYASYFSCAKSG